MSIDARFLIAISIMASIAYGCRVAGLIIGTQLGDSTKLRRFLDILPACAIGAVLGPAFAAMTLIQSLAIVVSTLVYLLSSRFLLALSLGTTVLLCGEWMMSLG